MTKFPLIVLILFILSGCGSRNSDDSMPIDSLYSLLDSEIAKSSDYEKLKKDRIFQLQRKLQYTRNDSLKFALTDGIVREFEAFNADSALHYININLQRPSVGSQKGAVTRLMIKRADIYGHAGLFADALQTMSSIPADSIIPELKEFYYSTYCAIYQYLCEYTNEHETSREYEHKRSIYTDSLNNVVKKDSFNHMIYVLTEMAREGKHDNAIKNLEENLTMYPEGTREYSIIASTLAYIYMTSDDMDKYKRYLALSAISDVKGAIKENMSFRAMAMVMFEEGDIERANFYLKKSIADATFYSAMMRNAQSSKMLPVIDDAYEAKQNRLTSRLRMLLLITGILSVVLIITVILILKQFRSLRSANAIVKKTNLELKDLSEKLREANIEMENKNRELNDLSSRLREANNSLETRNNELSEYNKTKEQYAGLFMEYCSSAISTLHQYQQSLRVLAAQGGSKTALLKKLDSSDTADSLLKNFYEKFDEAILKIFPSFVSRFNSLLHPDEIVIPKADEILNTELRLFALIRLGITDSGSIARFLRCSLSTVYTYRSKMKKRALNPDEFENQVKEI